MIRATELGKRYGARWIFRDLSFDVASGQCLQVIGANGSGKSTLLKVLASLIPASHGDIALAGPLGYASLEMNLYPQLTAIEHLEIAAQMRGVAARVDDLLAYVGLDHAASVAASQFSTGMKSRLKLALAIQARPPILLLDEPSAAMDETGRRLVADIVAEQLTRGCAVVATNDRQDRSFATHELELA